MALPPGRAAWPCRLAVPPATSSLVMHPAPQVPIAPLLALGDRVKGQIVLFIIFLGVVLLIVLFFAFVPFYSQGGTRDDAAWKAACDTYDTAVLSPLGLS